MSKKTQPIETHGKVESTQPTTLEQVWGFNELSRYGTLNSSEYEKQLKDMTRSDLESHARKVGVVILENSERLRGALLKEFTSYVVSLRKPAAIQSNTQLTPEALKVLREGR